MTFLSPIWLWLMLPWSLVALRMLRAHGRDESVPFLALWREATVAQPIRRGWRLPPVGVILLLAAMLLAIVAAGRPAIPGQGDAPPLTLIWDRGLTMAGRSTEVAKELPARLTEAGFSRQVNLHVIPGETMQTRADALTRILPQISLTAIDTGDHLVAAAVEALRQTDQPVIVVTGAALPLEDARLRVIHPPAASDNLGITALAMRVDPQPQVMVRIANHSKRTRAQLSLAFDGKVAAHEIVLPAEGESQGYFFEAPREVEVVSATLEVEDATALDNRAWLVRTGQWPRVVPAQPLPPAIQRMIDIYTVHRRPEGDAPTVVISYDQLADRSAGVMLVPASNHRVGQAWRMKDHPVLAHVGLEVTGQIRSGSADVPDGFEVILWNGDLPMIAVREQPARQVWIGMETSDLADQPVFVVLWANVLAWVGGEGGRYASQPPQTLGDGWVRVQPGPLPDDVQPGWVAGLYQNNDGARIAINSALPEGDVASSDQWQEALIGMERQERKMRVLSSALIVGAMVLAGMAAMMWSAGGLTRLYKGRTVAI